MIYNDVLGFPESSFRFFESSSPKSLRGYGMMEYSSCLKDGESLWNK